MRASEGDSNDDRRSPIFILGISQRSGTNFLADLICLHPDCGPPAPIWEDHLLYHADPLLEYVESLSESWHRWIDGHGEQGDFVQRHLGLGLLSLLSERSVGKRVVTKTPSVRNLDRFFQFFPSAHLLILVRDGRAVVESQLKMAGGSFDAACHRWAEAAEAILRFDETMKGVGGHYCLVRYEDLVRDLRGELTKLLTFLKLDPDAYDFTAAEHLPVRGSSVFGRGAGDVHWNPVEPNAAFAPLARWAHWTPRQHARFNWIAGRQLERLGYPPTEHMSRHPVGRAWNRALDAAWALGEAVASIRRSLRRRMGASRGERVRQGARKAGLWTD